jgi:hypothetical protein
MAVPKQGARFDGCPQARHIAAAQTGMPVIYLRRNGVYSRNTMYHEFFHTLGSHHQKNFTNSIMSYSRDKQILYSDLARLTSNYRALQMGFL